MHKLAAFIKYSKGGTQIFVYNYNRWDFYVCYCSQARPPTPAWIALSIRASCTILKAICAVVDCMSSVCFSVCLRISLVPRPRVPPPTCPGYKATAECTRMHLSLVPRPHVPPPTCPGYEASCRMHQNAPKPHTQATCFSSHAAWICTRMHLRRPKLTKISWGSMPPDPPKVTKT